MKRCYICKKRFLTGEKYGSAFDRPRMYWHLKCARLERMKQHLQSTPFKTMFSFLELIKNMSDTEFDMFVAGMKSFRNLMK